MALGIPTDDATALGIAVCVEYGLGFWIGLRLNLALITAIQRRLASLTERIGRLYAQSGIKTEEQRNQGKPGNLPADISLALIVPTQMGAMFGSILGIASATEFYTGVHRIPAEWMTASALALIATALLGIAFQTLFMLWVNTKLTAMEEQLKLEPSRAISTFLEGKYPERYRAKSYFLLSKVGGTEQGTGAA